MKAQVRANQRRAMLDAEEASLGDRLLAILPGVSTGGSQLFLNATNSPNSTSRYSHEEAGDLFASAKRCMELRADLGLDAAGSVADKFLIACREAASGDAHRRGPRKLAEWLFTKITS
jgi:hypothetical protein